MNSSLLFEKWVDEGGDEKNAVGPLARVIRQLRPNTVKFDFREFGIDSKQILKSIRVAKVLLGTDTEGMEIRLPGAKDFKEADQRDRKSMSTSVMKRISDARIFSNKTLDVSDLKLTDSVKRCIPTWLGWAGLKDVQVVYENPNPVQEKKKAEPVVQSEEPRMDTRREAHYRRLIAERETRQNTTAGLKREIEKLQADLETADRRVKEAERQANEFKQENKDLRDQLVAANAKLADFEAKELADEMLVACPTCGQLAPVRNVDGFWLIECSSGHKHVRALDKIIRRWTIV